MNDITYNLMDGTATVELTQGQHTVIDRADVDMVKNLTWHAFKKHGRFFASTNINKRAELLHNYLMGRKGINHRDRDGLNNRRSNLRPATRAESTRSRPKRQDNTSGYKGVTRDQNRQKFAAQIRIGPHEQVNLGRFDDAADAARAYDRAAIKHFGEFAFLNFPDEKDAYMAGVCVIDEGRCGTLTKTAPLLENISGLEGGANGNN